jgi:hypothetical protein
VEVVKGTGERGGSPSQRTDSTNASGSQVVVACGLPWLEATESLFGYLLDRLAWKSDDSPCNSHPSAGLQLGNPTFSTSGACSTEARHTGTRTTHPISYDAKDQYCNEVHDPMLQLQEGPGGFRGMGEPGTIHPHVGWVRGIAGTIRQRSRRHNCLR